MSNSIIEGLIQEKDYIFKKGLFRIIKDASLSTMELLLLIYFLNQEKIVFETKTIKKITLMEEKEIMEVFSSLTTKGFVSLKVVKDESGKVNEIIDLTGLYQAMAVNISSASKEDISQNIFDQFEKEFARPLTPMEYEIINAWLKSGINEELIIGALKEATFNGVSSLRYIDKIIYEWGKKGFKNINDVNKHLQTPNKDKTEKKELFDYNWLEDEE